MATGGRCSSGWGNGGGASKAGSLMGFGGRVLVSETAWEPLEGNPERK